MTAGMTTEMQPQLIEVIVNGEPKQVFSGHSVAALLDDLKIVSDRVAIELNKSVVRKRDWHQTTVASGARIEIIEFVGGG